MPLYLGLDWSTQSASAVVIEVDSASAHDASARRVVCDVSLPFDSSLPSYGTRSGVLADEDPRVVHSTPLMWVEALDLIFERLREEKIDLGAIAAISGSGQQHGSVYLADRFEDVLADLDSSRGLAEQLSDCFSRATSPIWMDSSTATECAEITSTLGGPDEVAQLTGSRAFERFTGPQIRKFYKNEPEAYADTETIHLVSSFMASVLAGRNAPIDRGDGAGMNLMDLRRGRWAIKALAATAPGLGGKLPDIEESSHVIGPVSPYFVERYGVSPGARVVTWTGDNPSSLIGVGLVEAGRIAISLGTSDTLFGFMPDANVDSNGEGHVFGSPTGHFMSLICFLNGSLAREKVRDRFGLDWAGFEAALERTAPGNAGRVLLPWFNPEITPTVLDPSPRTYGLDESDRDAMVRAVVEAQMASMVIHSRWMGVETKSIFVTGGGSRNRGILQIIADIHGADVFPFAMGNSAALGAALRAWHGERSSAGDTTEWLDIVRGFAEPSADAKISPRPEHRALCERFIELYAACEEHALLGGPDPAAMRASFA